MTEGATQHERIVTGLRARIVSGQWPAGHRLPSENDLAESHGVSRMTMNKALAQLAREGFVERKRRMGTVVAAPRMQSAVVEIADIAQEIRLLGRAYAYRLMGRRVRDALAADRAALRPADDARFRVVEVTALHLADGVPFCHEERLIHLGAVPAAETADFVAGAPGAWLLREVPWSAAEHVIRAVPASAALSRTLALRPGAACLEIARRTEFGGLPVTFARLTYPGDRHQLVAGFSPLSPPVTPPASG